MSFRYINPGYVHLLDKDAQATATQVTGYEYSKTGVAFYQTSTNRGVTLPDFAEGDDFWVRFDCHIKAPSSSNSSITIYAPHAYQFGLVISMNGGYFRISIWWANSIDKRLIDTSWGNASLYGIKTDAINSMLVHIKYDAGDGYLLELIINDKKYTASGSTTIPYSSTPKHAVIANYSGNPISNVIISNEEISPKEQVVALPVSATETAMTLQSETYIADSVGQMLLQSVNVSAFIDEYGSDSKVTGIALVGNPAYRTGEQLSSLTAISKRGGVITEHGTSNLSTASDTMILQGFSTASDTTIADLQNIQLGWKAGE